MIPSYLPPSKFSYKHLLTNLQIHGNDIKDGTTDAPILTLRRNCLRSSWSGHPPLLPPADKKTKTPHPDHFHIKRRLGNVFECSFNNVFSTSPNKLFWCPDGSVYLDKPKKGTVVAKAEKGGLLRIAGEVDMLTIVVLAIVARTWTGKSSCSCIVI